jgi:putative ABC transport system permease protein
MIKHQLLLILRGFIRYKSTFFINLIGLSTALACTLLIYLWVSDERSVDTFHEKEGRLFQVMSNEVINNEVITGDGTAGVLGEIWMNEMPEVEMATVITPPSWFQKFTVSGHENHLNASGYFADKNYFNVFFLSARKGK